MASKRNVARTKTARTNDKSTGRTLPRVARAKKAGPEIPPLTRAEAIAGARRLAELHREEEAAATAGAKGAPDRITFSHAGADYDLVATTKGARDRLVRIEEAAFTAQRELEDATDCMIEGYAGRDAASAGDSLIDALHFLRAARRLLDAIRRESVVEVTS